MNKSLLCKLIMLTMARIKSKTPPWFKFIRNVSTVLCGLSTIVATSTIPLPTIVITVSGYCAIAGAVAALVAQTAIEGE